LRKSVTDFEEIRHRFWGNQPPILRKSAADFEEICPRLWGNPSPILGKSAFGKTGSVFGTSRLRFWKKTVSVFGKAGSVFCDKLVRFGGKLAWFLDWLAAKLKSPCFER